jgi:hypothetical protein
VKSVHIFVRGDGMRDVKGVDGWREGELNEDAIDVWILVEGIDFGEEGFFGNGFGEFYFDGADANGLAGLRFAFDIDLGSGVISDEDDGEAGGAGSQAFDFSFDFALNFVSNLLSIDDHAYSPQVNRCFGCYQLEVILRIK